MMRCVRVVPFARRRLRLRERRPSRGDSGDDGFETLPLRHVDIVFGEFFILFALERGRPRDVGAGVEKLGVDGVDVRLEDGERAFNLVYDLRRVGRLCLLYTSPSPRDRG